MARRRRRAELAIVELAVDPSDVDSGTYPVRIRLTRPLTPYEAEGLAMIEPDLRCEGDAIVVNHATLDDVARAHETWAARLERVPESRVEVSGDVVRLRVRDGSMLVGELLGDLAADGVPPVRVEVARPTLDDVFLDLTGRSLRETHATETADNTDENEKDEVAA